MQRLWTRICSFGKITSYVGKIKVQSLVLIEATHKSNKSDIFGLDQNIMAFCVNVKFSGWEKPCMREPGTI